MDHSENIPHQGFQYLGIKELFKGIFQQDPDNRYFSSVDLLLP